MNPVYKELGVNKEDVDPEKAIDAQYIEQLSKTSWEELKAMKPGAQQTNLMLYTTIGVVIAIIVVAVVIGYYSSRL